MFLKRNRHYGCNIEKKGPMMLPGFCKIQVLIHEQTKLL